MQTNLLTGHITSGLVIRVVGRGTMQESHAFQTAIESNIDDGVELIVFDATDCEYLDSTFLGCLIGIQKAAEQSPLRRFVIAASKAKRVTLFCTSALDRFFDFVDVCPDLLDELESIDIDQLGPVPLGRHIAGCHQRLADRGGRDAAAFRSIADRLTKELGDDAPT